MSGPTTVLPQEISPSVDLSVSLRQEIDELFAGNGASYTLRVSNNGTTFAKAAQLSASFENSFEHGQFLRTDLDSGDQVVLAEREKTAHNIHVWEGKAIFNNAENPPFGLNPLFLLDLHVDAVEAIDPVEFRPDLAPDHMKSFATEVVEFQPNESDRDVSDAPLRNNPFAFLGNTSGFVDFDTMYLGSDAPTPSITVRFPGPVVDGPGDDIEVRMQSYFGRESIPVYGRMPSGQDVFLVNLQESNPFIDLSEITDSGPFTALRFAGEGTESGLRLISVEATIEASAILTASAPNNLDYEFSWDLNNDGVFGDRIGRSIGFPAGELEPHGISEPGEYPISVKMNDRVMDYFDETTFVVLEEETVDAIVGDINADGAVSFADFLVLSMNFGTQEAGPEEGDLDGDGVVGLADFLLLQKNYGVGGRKN